jgi:hypothetical protein
LFYTSNVKYLQGTPSPPCTISQLTAFRWLKIECRTRAYTTLSQSRPRPHHRNHANHANHTHDANIHCVNYPPNSAPAILPHQHPFAPSATKNSANRAFPCAPTVIGFTMPASTASTPCSLRLAARQTIGFQRTLKPIIGFHVAFYVDVVPCAGAGGLLAGGDETKPTMLRGAAGSLGVIWERRPPVGVGETLLVLVLLSCILTLHCGIHCSLFSLRL